MRDVLSLAVCYRTKQFHRSFVVSLLLCNCVAFNLSLINGFMYQSYLWDDTQCQIKHLESCRRNNLSVDYLVNENVNKWKHGERECSVRVETKSHYWVMGFEVKCFLFAQKVLLMAFPCSGLFITLASISLASSKGAVLVSLPLLSCWLNRKSIRQKTFLPTLHMLQLFFYCSLPSVSHIVCICFLWKLKKNKK